MQRLWFQLATLEKNSKGKAFYGKSDLLYLGNGKTKKAQIWKKLVLRSLKTFWEKNECSYNVIDFFSGYPSNWNGMKSLQLVQIHPQEPEYQEILDEFRAQGLPNSFIVRVIIKL